MLAGANQAPIQIVGIAADVRQSGLTDPDQLLTNVKTMDDVVAESEGQRRSIMRLLGIFAALGLSLAVAGIYGVIAYAVSQRTRELGIRRALGAQDGDILSLVLTQGLALAVVGTAIGIAGALALTRVLSGLLFGVSATDVPTFAGIALAIVLVALLACGPPARRASRIDPAQALRV